MKYNDEVIRAFLNKSANDILFTDFKLPKSFIDEFGIHDYSVGAFLMLDEPYEYYEYRFVFDFVNLEYETQAQIIDAFEDSIYKRFNSVNHDLYIEKRGFPDSKYRELFPNINPDEIMRVSLSINFKKYL